MRAAQAQGHELVRDVRDGADDHDRRPPAHGAHAQRNTWTRILDGYGRSLDWVFARQPLMLLVERRLHAMRGGALARQSVAAGDGWLSSWLDTLPPLLTLETLLFRLIGAGFVLLTLTLLSGILFNEQLADRALQLDHKTVFALLSWLMFGALLTARKVSGWRGRAALRWVLASFVALLLAYVGSRFVFEVLLHRPVV